MRLIDADALAEKVQFRLPIDNYNAEVISSCVNITRRLIENAPTIDAVPVVRCAKCKYSMLWRKPTDKAVGDCIIRKMHSEDDWFYAVAADDFCSYGEKRDE